MNVAFLFTFSRICIQNCIFDINPSTVPDYCRGMTNVAIMGSSNLTKPGFSLDDEMSSDELCYRLPTEKYSEAYSYAKQLVKKANDLNSYVMRMKRR